MIARADPARRSPDATRGAPAAASAAAQSPPPHPFAPHALTAHPNTPLLGYTTCAWLGYFGPRVWRNLIIGAFVAVIGISLGGAIERIQRLTFLYAHAARRELQVAEAHRRADSKLNHIVKNQCGTASGRLQTLLKRLTSGARAPSHLEVAKGLATPLADLQQVADWCLRRETLLQVETETYQSVRTRCEVRGLVQSTLADDGTVYAKGPVCVLVDEKILHLAIVEGLSNARK